jgi:hypothetical protein
MYGISLLMSCVREAFKSLYSNASLFIVIVEVLFQSYLAVTDIYFNFEGTHDSVSLHCRYVNTIQTTGILILHLYAFR